MSNCPQCGHPVMTPNMPYSYAGPVCLCFQKLGDVTPRPAQLTEEDVRRIVRDELGKPAAPEQP